RIHALDSRNSLAVQPRAKAAPRRAMRRPGRMPMNDQRLYLNPRTFERTLRNAIVTLQRVCQDEDLSAVRWVGKCLHVTGHPGIEDYFAPCFPAGAKRAAAEDHTVIQHESHGIVLSPKGRA